MTRLEREKETLRRMIALYCRHKGGQQGAMRRLSASAGICLPAVGTLPLRKSERRLQGLPDALLRPGLSGEDPGRDALCRAADAALSSRCGYPTSFSDGRTEPIRAIGIFQPPEASFSRSFSRVFHFQYGRIPLLQAKVGSSSSVASYPTANLSKATVNVRLLIR